MGSTANIWVRLKEFMFCQFRFKFLECLTLSNCTIARSIFDPVVNAQSVEEGNNKPKLFNSLRKLVIRSNISPSQVSHSRIYLLAIFLCFQFLVLTGHAYSLESLHTGISCWVSTRLLSHLLQLNSLHNLQTLR